MAVEHDSDSVMARAVRIVGSQSAFARLVGRSQSSVYNRVKNGRLLWAEDVPVVEAATGISRHDLRPDIFGPAPGLPAARAEYEHAR